MHRLLLPFAIFLSVFADDPNAGVNKAIQQQCIEAADAIRKIKIEMPQDTLQIASMANDYLAELYSGINAINSAIPNSVQQKNSHKALTDIADLLSGFANRIQQVYLKKSSKLKETLANILQETSVAVSQYNDYFNDGHNRFGNNAINRLNFFQLFGIFQLKYQALLFQKTNEELVGEAEKSEYAFGETLQDVECADDKVCEVQLRIKYIDGAVLIQRFVYKLLYWVAVNPDSSDSELVTKAAVTLSKEYTRLIQTAAQDKNYSALKNELVVIYDSCLTAVKGLASLTYPNNTGGLEFIRSVLYETVAVGYEFATHFKAAVSG